MTDQTDSDGTPEAALPVTPEVVPAAVVDVPVAVALETPPAEVKPVAVKPATAKPVRAKPVVAAEPVVQPKPVKPKAAKPAPARKPIKIKRPLAAAPRQAKKPAAAAITEKLTVTQLKDKIMATKTTDFTGTLNKSMTEAVSDMQSKAQAAYDKGTGMVAEMTELAKGHVEAVVESSKIMASGMQDLGKTYAEEAKSAYETLTADIKEMAAIKSPTDLFQLQGKIMRRNFDAMVATSTKGSESAMKLANDVIAPLSARVTLAVEKLSKAA